MEVKKKNVLLVKALSISVLVIAFIAISIYSPAMFIKPKTDFIYSGGADDCYQNRYSVENGKIIEHEILCLDYRKSRLFFYHINHNTKREITPDEAAKFTVDIARKSPDGFEIVPGGFGFDSFSFSGSSFYEKYLKKGVYKRKLNMGPTSYYEFKFIGWVR